ncbi:ATP-binding protein [Lichenihabitans sp. Uapishka_5]|uniref:ATP-binding protein n=1 Tax=Lichenihabitans sp. Uapishka_5 TaxID=3037302 RepID=UPI0029E81C30|nr:ATP-binding protein [Lichenihabitans sp. Uapishka_5]MDX7953569.1 ATP-binding protein [Lichenihabitans sp. Uapishka_5]
MTRRISSLGISLRRHGRRPVAAALALALVIATILAGAAWRYHAGLVSEAQDRTARLSFLLSEQAARTFEAVDITLRGLEPLLAGAGDPAPATDLDAMLRRRAAELSVVQAIRVSDADGRVVSSSDPDAVGTLDLGCRAALAVQTAPALAIGCSLGDVGASGRATITVARRLGRAGDAFQGFIVADLDPGYFSRFFSDLDLGPHSVITLVETHGHVLLASTRPAGDEAPTRRQLVPPTERLRLGQLQQDAQAQITATHAADGYPLSVQVGIDRSTVARRWWQMMMPSFVLTMAVGGLLLALALTIERHQAERVLVAQRAAVAQKLESMGQMTASVAHDFRNVLTALQGSLRLIGKRGADPTVLREAGGTLARGGAMVDRLLAFSRRQELRPETHDVGTLLHELQMTLQHVAGLDAKVEVEVADDLKPCWLDKVQFEAALMNLVVNARQAMPGGGSVFVVARALADMPDRVEVLVRDTGCGIDAATLRRVFEPFFTTKAQTGTGLGLAQVQAMMADIGGTVEIASTVGVGTTVSLRLPVASAAETVAAAALVLDPV